MFRLTTFATIAFFMAVASANAPPRSGLSIFGLGTEEDIYPEEDSMPLLDEEQTRTNVGELGAVLFTIRNQFKEIIEEIGVQVFEYAKNILHNYKVKLLKKLSLYTLKDVFHAVFDGVADFVVDTSPEIAYYDAIKEVHKPVKPTHFHDGFSLASLFRSARS